MRVRVVVRPAIGDLLEYEGEHEYDDPSDAQSDLMHARLREVVAALGTRIAEIGQGGWQYFEIVIAKRRAATLLDRIVALGLLGHLEQELDALGLRRLT